MRGHGSGCIFWYGVMVLDFVQVVVVFFDGEAMIPLSSQKLYL